MLGRGWSFVSGSVVCERCKKGAVGSIFSGSPCQNKSGVDLPSKYPTVEALLARADSEYPKGGKKEGIVIRPTEPVSCERISAALSMKVVSNKYLLKNEDR